MDPSAKKRLRHMKIFLYLFIFIGPLYSMLPDSVEDIDYELCYIEMIMSNLESSLDEFNSITDYKKGIERFKDLCIRYRTMTAHPSWISELFNEPEEEEEEEEQPPSDNEDD